MKKIFLILFCSLYITTLFAQADSIGRKARKAAKQERINAMAKLDEEGVITYVKHTAGGFKFTSDGYGAFFEIGRTKSTRKSLLYQLDISERKNSKEEKQQGPYQTTVPIIYGKINYFYPVKLGAQLQYVLGNKGNKNGVSVTANIGGGIVLGLLRPYMIEVDKQGQRTYVKYESADSSYFLNGPYYGGPNLGTGWNQLKLVPGLYAKPAIRFDYGKYNEKITAIEVGLSVEYYTKEIPQIIYMEQKQFFLTTYVAIIFGGRK